MSEKMEQTSEPGKNAAPPSRRHVLKLGALAAPAVATLSPAMALAQDGAAVSLITCQIDLPTEIDGYGWPVTETTEVVESGTRKVYADNPVYGPAKIWRISTPTYSGQTLQDELLDRGIADVDVTTESLDEFGAILRYLVNVRDNTFAGTGASCLTSVLNRSLTTV